VCFFEKDQITKILYYKLDFIGGRKMFNEMLDNVRKVHPLVHCITNYVTVNDCANIVLACGGSPIMSDYSGEVEEITSICDGLAINMGTLNEDTIAAMLLAGKKSNVIGHPIILDPVGVGASKLRNETAKKLLDEVKFTTIRGNISEVKALSIGTGTTRGVDADAADTVTDETLDDAVALAKEFSKKTGSVIVITGAIDIVADEKTAYIIRNGNSMMANITGSGCMLTAMTGAFLAANVDCTPSSKDKPNEPNRALIASAASVCVMGLCGELALEKIEKMGGGNSSFRNYLIDAVYNLDGDTLMRGAKYEIK
jgi:hydroxyethylthiazole kinase